MVKPKKCKFCKNTYTPTKPLSVVCSATCAFGLARINGLKKMEKAKEKERLAINKEIENIKTKSNTLVLQGLINKIVRLIDAECNCISCGSKMNHNPTNYTDRKNVNAGHYNGVGSDNSVRFHLHNIWAQCVNCNKDKDGNGSKYAKALMEIDESLCKYVLDLPTIYKCTKLMQHEQKEAITKAKHIAKGLVDMNKTEQLPRSYERRIELRTQFNKYIGIYD